MMHGRNLLRWDFANQRLADRMMVFFETWFQSLETSQRFSTLSAPLLITDRHQSLEINRTMSILYISNDEITSVIGEQFLHTHRSFIISQKSDYFEMEIKNFFKLFYLRELSMKDYLETTDSISSIPVLRSDQIRDCIETLRNNKHLQINPALCRRVEQCAYELLMNAFYDAEKNSAGKQQYFETSRTQRLHAKKGKAPVFSYGFDETFFILSVTDQYGSFAYNDFSKILIQNLSKGGKTVRNEGAGAGIGFFLCLQNVSTLIVNVDYKRKTEVLAIFQRSKRNRDHQITKTSLIFSTNEDYNEVA